MCYLRMNMAASLSAPDHSLAAKRESWVHDEGEEVMSSKVIYTDGEAMKQRNKGCQCQRAGMGLESPL